MFVKLSLATQNMLYFNCSIKKIGSLVNMADNVSDNESEEEDIDYVPEFAKLSHKEAASSSSEDESSGDDCDCGDEPPSYVVIPSVSKHGQSVSSSTLVDAVPYSSRSNTVLGKNQTEWSGRPISANLEPKIIRRGYGK